MPKPTRDDVRAAIDSHGAVDWRGVEDTDAVAGDAVEAVMPFVDQSYEAGMAAVRDELYTRLQFYRQRMEQTELLWRNVRPNDHDALLAHKLAEATYSGFLAAFHFAQNFSVGNSEKSVGVAWPGATPHTEGEN